MPKFLTYSNPEICVVYAAKFWSNVFCSGEKVMYIARCLSTAHLYFPLSMLLKLQVCHYLSALMSSPSDQHYVLHAHLCAYKGGAA